MPGPFRLLVATGALAVCAAASPARALPVEQYLKLRRQAGFNPRITLAQVQAAPAAFSGRVLELRGTVEGYIRRESMVSFLLSVSGSASLLLNSPASDVALVTSSNRQPLRVLVRVAENSAGNAVPLEALGAAYDAEVSSRERRAAAEAAASAPRVRQIPPRAPAAAVSRGHYARPMAAASAGVSVLAMRVLSPEAQAVYPAYRDFIRRRNRRLAESEVDTITCSILHFSQANRVDPRLVIALVIAESSFNPYTTSHKGAMGLGQLMPDEARAHRLTNPYDPVQNLRVSIGLLRNKLDRYKNAPLPAGQYTEQQIVLALAAYNAGPGAVRRYGGVPPYRETQGYVKKVMRIYRELIGQPG